MLLDSSTRRKIVTSQTASPTPVLLATFNRPDLTQEVLAAIREARPERLFVASDGPRPNVESDAAKVAATRAIVEEMVDWPCRVERRFSDTNQGCRVGVSSAISWFFEHVEEGIILEDDCVPYSDFFGYCTELLERYRDDDRVMSIAGDNSVGLTPTDTTASYCFTRQPLIWGWATWRRAWQHYDGDLDGWLSLRSDPTRLEQLWRDPIERRWQASQFEQLVLTGRPDSWSYRWTLTVLLAGGLSATPNVNLVKNVGFGPSATHTFGTRNRRAAVPTQPILPLHHPQDVARDQSVEHQIFDRVHGGAAMRSPLRRSAAGAKRRLGPTFRPALNALRARLGRRS